MRDNQALDERLSQIVKSESARQCVFESYAQYESELTKFAARNFGIEFAEAQDVVHTAFEKFAGYKNVLEIENPRAYLYRLVNNIASNNFRHSTVHKKYVSKISDTDETSEGSEVGDPAVVNEHRQSLDLISELLLKMPVKRRRIVILNRFEHLSYAEIGRQLDISEAAVRKHIKKAMTEIREGMESN